jgi:hypothetical protein
MVLKKDHVINRDSHITSTCYSVFCYADEHLPTVSVGGRLMDVGWWQVAAPSLERDREPTSYIPLEDPSLMP